MPLRSPKAEGSKLAKQLGYPHPRAFLKKRLQSIENKGRGLWKKSPENSRGGKRLKGKEIEEVEEVKECRRGVLLERGAGETMIKRAFTRL
jgi:hypothetical protein